MELKTIIKRAGGVTNISKVCGISKAAVSQWDVIPPRRCLAIEAASNGSVTRYDMRPDVFGVQPVRMQVQ